MSGLIKAFLGLAGHPDDAVLQAFADEELNVAKSRKVRRHIDGCAQCGAFVSTVASVYDVAGDRQADEDDLLRTVRERLFARIDRRDDTAILEIRALLGGKAAFRATSGVGRVKDEAEALLGRRAGSALVNRVQKVIAA